MGVGFECPRCGYRTLSWRDPPFCDCPDEDADKQKEAFAKLWPHIDLSDHPAFKKDEEEDKSS